MGCRVSGHFNIPYTRPATPSQLVLQRSQLLKVGDGGWSIPNSRVMVLFSILPMLPSEVFNQSNSRYFGKTVGFFKANIKIMIMAAAYYIICLALKKPHWFFQSRGNLAKQVAAIDDN